MARTNSLANFLTDIADAIRAKKGTEEEILAANFDTEIADINTASIEDSKTVTPTTSAQNIVPSEGYDGIASVTVNAVTAAIDSSITADNIAQGVTVLGVEGIYDGGVAAALGGAY